MFENIGEEMEPDDDKRHEGADRERMHQIEDLGKLSVPKNRLGVPEALIFTESVLMELRTCADKLPYGEMKAFVPRLDEALAVIQRVSMTIAPNPARALEKAQELRRLRKELREHREKSRCDDT